MSQILRTGLEKRTGKGPEGTEGFTEATPGTPEAGQGV